MATGLFNRIIEYMDKNSIKYELSEHKSVYTSSEASKVSGHTENEGTKSLALDTEKGVVVVTVSGNERVDFNSIKRLFNLKKIEMCDAKKIADTLHTEIGGIAPFGYDKNIKIVVSNKLFENSKVYFNPGKNNATICVDGETFKKIMIKQGAQVI